MFYFLRLYLHWKRNDINLAGRVCSTCEVITVIYSQVERTRPARSLLLFTRRSSTFDLRGHYCYLLAGRTYSTCEVITVIYLQVEYVRPARYYYVIRLFIYLWFTMLTPPFQIWSWFDWSAAYTSHKIGNTLAKDVSGWVFRTIMNDKDKWDSPEKAIRIVRFYHLQFITH